MASETSFYSQLAISLISP